MFGIEKQLDRIVETIALSALMASNPSKKVEKRLKEIAFPLEIELWYNVHIVKIHFIKMEKQVYIVVVVDGRLNYEHSNLSDV